MEGSLELSFRGMTPTPEIEQYVRERVSKLDQTFDELIACEVVVEQRHHTKRTGNQYHVRVDLHVPNAVLVASTEQGDEPSHQDVYATVNDSFSAARRQLLEYLQRRRGDGRHRQNRIET